MHLMERKMGVGTGGREHWGGHIGGVRPVLLSSSPFLSLGCGRRGGVTDICFGNIFTHWLALLDEELVDVLCVRTGGGCSRRGFCQNPKICSNSRFHNGVKWSEEMSAWPWHCTVILGSVQQSSLSHTHTECWLVGPHRYIHNKCHPKYRRAEKLTSKSWTLLLKIWALTWVFLIHLNGKFFHHFPTIMSFQTCVFSLLLWTTKRDVW